MGKPGGCVEIILAMILACVLEGQVRVQKLPPSFRQVQLTNLREMFFNYLNEYPHEAQTDWSGGLQGVAHDNDNWYFTSAFENGEHGYLMKFPLYYGLTRGIPENAHGCEREPAGIRSFNKATIPGNPLGSFRHMGDLEYWDGFFICSC
jgi:hypothetical protein